MYPLDCQDDMKLVLFTCCLHVMQGSIWSLWSGLRSLKDPFSVPFFGIFILDLHSCIDDLPSCIDK